MSHNPQTLGELARMEDRVPTKAAPPEVQAALASARTTISVPSCHLTTWAQESARMAHRSGDDHMIVLPERAFTGVRVRETVRHEVGSLPKPTGPIEPHCPEWARFSTSLRPAGVEQRMLTRRNGRQVMATDSGRAYGEYPARMPFYPSSYPYNCIGRIFVWTDATAANWSYYGSATLIGSRAILTAGHIVPWGSGSNWKAHFVAGYYDGNPAPGPGAQSWVTDAHGWNPNNSVVAHDMAVMRLQDPLGDWLGSFGSKAYADNWEGGPYWNLVGYPSAITAERPSWQGGIHTIDDDEDGDAQELEHHGDDTGGDSGGPFFGFWSGQPYVIGTVSGYEVINGVFGIGSEDNNIVAGGPALNTIIHYARDNWK